MVLGDILVTSIRELGQIGIWLKTAGILFILWVIFQSITLFLNTKRMKEVYKIKEDMKRIEKKINKILKSLKQK